MKKIIITVLAVAMAAVSSFAAVNNNASIIFPLLSMGVGARALGMGDAYTAVADDASAVYWNTAGLSRVKSGQLGLTYDKWFVDTMFGQIQFAYPLSVGTIGADIIYLNTGSLMGMDDSGHPTQALNLYNIGGCVGYGISLTESISVGVALKLISQSTGNLSSSGIAADAGFLFKTGIFAAGLNLQNIGSSSGSGYSLPTNIKVGIAVKPIDERSHGLLLALDTQYILKDSVSLSAGVEYLYDKMFALRLGYKTIFGNPDLEGITGISGGVGVKLGSISFDYALVPYGDLGLTQKATLSYNFGAAAGGKPVMAVKPDVKAKTAAKVKPDVKNVVIKSALYDAALVLEKKGEIDQAVAKYKEALIANAKIADGWNRLGRLYLKKNNKVEAIKCYDEYMKLTPTDSETAEWLKKYKAAK